MPYTVTELITRAYYLSSVVARDYQEVNGSQMSDGLVMLNSLLSSFSTNTILIPYYKKYDIVPPILTNGVNNYFISGLIFVDNLTFYINGNPAVRYSSYSLGRTNFFGTARAENINSLPWQWHFERELNGGRIYLYFSPQDVSKITVWGKFTLTDVALNDDLLQEFDLFYIDFLRYSLAEYICAENQISTPLEVVNKLNEYKEKLITISPIDFNAQKSSTLTKVSSLNYGDINAGRGFRPVSSSPL